MSTTETKRPLAQATADAIAFAQLFDGCSDLWAVAGSVRRCKPEVGDIEHVCIPKMGEVPTGGLFGGVETVNLLWRRLDGLVADGTLMKHVYQTVSGPQFRWGEKYRGVDFRGFNNEIFCADTLNFGSTLLIRTGPAEYSKNFVDRFLCGGLYRQQGGHLIHIKSGQIVPVPDEETYYKMAGLPFIPPQKRLA